MTDELQVGSLSVKMALKAAQLHYHHLERSNQKSQHSELLREIWRGPREVNLDSKVSTRAKVHLQRKKVSNILLL